MKAQWFEKKKKKTFLDVPFLMDHCCTVVPGCIQHLRSKRVLLLWEGVISSVITNLGNSMSQEVFCLF